MIKIKKDIVVVSLFDGLSGGRIALSRIEHLNVLRYYSSEVDKYAIQVASHNYPQDDAYRLGDVTKIDTAKLLKEIRNDFGDTDVLLLGGSPCFVAGTKVIEKNSLRNIEDVKVGDNVMTHSGTFKRVLATGSKLSKTIIVKAQGLKPTETTKEHPYYVRKMKRVWDNTKRRDIRVFSSPEWKEASKMEIGDFIGVNINQESENPLRLTAEECFILGRYIADGHTRKDFETSEGGHKDRNWQLILSIGTSKLGSFCKNIKDNHYSSYKHSDSVQRVVFSNKRLVQIAEAYCGIGAVDKIFHQVFINLPTELLSPLLHGYLDGGGSFRDGAYRATSISEELILALSQVVAKVYQTNSSYSYCKRPKTCVIKGRTVNQNDTYTLEFRTEMKKQSNAKVIDGIIWLPFKESFATNETKQVFNLEVEDDNSYTANNAIVHNCQGFSMAGKLQGSSTVSGVDVVTYEQYEDLKSKHFEFNGQSYLFWEYVRIKQEINPTYFMLENVRITKKWLPMFNDAMGVEPIRINSSLVSAQNRNRYYWHNLGEIAQPKDKGIVLKDIIEDGTVDRDKSLCATTRVAGATAKRYLEKSMHQMVIERPCELREFKQSSACHHVATASDIRGNESTKRVYADSGKSPAVTTCQGGHREPKVLLRPKRVKTLNKGGQGGRVYDTSAKGITLASQSGGTAGNGNMLVSEDSGATYRKLTPLECERLQTLHDNYTLVLDKKGKQLVSNSQRYKMIGNGWTIDVPVHILSYISKEVDDSI